jgi:hypothetical protein
MLSVRCRPAKRRPPRRMTALPRLLLSMCASVTAVTFVGMTAQPAEAAPQKWSVTSSPDVGSGDDFAGVSCLGSAFCAAVGSYDGGDRTLTELWNGSSWSVTASPSPGGDPDELFGVSCFDADSCMAVGWYYNTSIEDYDTLALYWDGSSWSMTTTPSPSVQSVLYGVSCTALNSCMAVGYDDGVSGFVTLVESWNGSVWSVVSSPNVGPYNSVLQSVSCLNSVTCMAVGWYDGSSGSETLVESWNGSMWSVVSSPDPGSGNNELLGVSCFNSTSCTAVGLYSVGFGPSLTLVETSSGRTWSAVVSENKGERSNQLRSVSCTSTSNCVAVGYREVPDRNDRTLVESSGPRGWHIARSRNPAATDQLFALNCIGSRSCQAVGDNGSGSVISQATLVETGS